MIENLFGGNIGMVCGTFFLLFLVGLIMGILFKGVLKTIFIIIIILMACSFLGAVMVNWAAVVDVIGAATLILISLLLTAGSFTLGFIVGMMMSKKG